MAQRVGRFKDQIPKAYERVFGSPPPKEMSPTRQLEILTALAEKQRQVEAAIELEEWVAEGVDFMDLQAHRFAQAMADPLFSLSRAEPPPVLDENGTRITRRLG